MKIAVPYENNEVFQHFGHAKKMKIYETDGEKVISSLVTEPDAGGHDAMAAYLQENGIDLLICDGIGEEAIRAVSAKGITIIGGAKGNADEIVAMYLDGTLIKNEPGCPGCDEGSCDEGCGGCCHGQPAFEGKNVGKTVRVHYRGTFNDGTQFDASYDRGEPLEFVCGAGMMIPGFDKAVADLVAGETVDVHLMPSEAYGERNPEAVFTAEIAQMPGTEDLKVNDRVYLRNMYGQPFPVTVTAKDETTITFDANHEMAGKELNFFIEMVEIL